MRDPNDPYYKILEIVKKSLESSFRDSFLVGKVTSVNPLTFEVGGMPLSRKDVLISDHLLEGYKRIITLNSEQETLLAAADGLNTGDRVLVLITPDKQTYIVASKLI